MEGKLFRGNSPEGNTNERDREDEIISDLKTKKSEIIKKYITDNNVRALHKLTYEYPTDLEKKYPNARKYRLFHLLIGSTATSKECEYFDLPGEGSIEKYINELYEEAFSKK